MPRIRNWKDLTFFRRSKDAKYRHIDGLFSDTVDWQLIQDHRSWPTSVPTPLARFGSCRRRPTPRQQRCPTLLRPADHGHLRAVNPARTGFKLGCRVVDAVALEVRPPLEAQFPVVGAARDHDRAGRDLAPVRQGHHKVVRHPQ